MQTPWKAIPIAILTLLGTQAGAVDVTEGQMFGTWKATCEAGPCRVFLNLEKDSKQVLSWNVLIDASSKRPTFIISTPLGTALQPGLRLYADKDTFFDLPFQVCDETGCGAIAQASDAMLKALAGKTVVRIGYLSYGSPAPTIYEVPVDGLEASLAALGR